MILQPGEDQPRVCIGCDNEPPMQADGHTLCMTCQRKTAAEYALFLAFHGYLMPGETRRVKQRIKKNLMQ